MPPSHLAEQRLDRTLLRAWPLAPVASGDKYARGTVLVIGGSARTPGAVVLAGTSALRAGAGRLQIATSSRTATAVGVAVPEALVSGLDDGAGDDLAGRIARADAVVVGPGLEDGAEAQRLVDTVLEHAGVAATVVVDALGISALARRPAHDRSPTRRIVITPNRYELEQLLDGSADDQRSDGSADDQRTDGSADDQRTDGSADDRRIEAVVAARFGVVVSSFGCVAAPDGRLWVDGDEVIGLGTSGAGDVLAGALGGLAARNGDPAQTACWGTIAHRLAAARLAGRVAPLGYLARELADELPAALADLEG
jgi:hydroxyethylthiazole kinase-like uncharacterized protein yjeF